MCQQIFEINNHIFFTWQSQSDVNFKWYILIIKTELLKFVIVNKKKKRGIAHYAHVFVNNQTFLKWYWVT